MALDAIDPVKQAKSEQTKCPRKVPNMIPLISYIQYETITKVLKFL